MRLKPTGGERVLPRSLSEGAMLSRNSAGTLLNIAEGGMLLPPRNSGGIVLKWALLGAVLAAYWEAGRLPRRRD